MLNNELQNIVELAKRLLSGACNYDELTASISAATVVIPLAWEKAVFSAAPPESLLRYFDYHLEGIRKISDTLYLSSASLCATASAGEAYSVFQMRLMELTVHLIDNFRSYFNTEMLAPYAYHETLVGKLHQPYRELTGAIEIGNLPVPLKTILKDYFGVMMTAGGRTYFTFAALFYFDQLLMEMAEATKESGPKQITGAIVGLLTALNFNHLGFLTFKVQALSAELGKMPSPKKLDTLRTILFELKWKPEGNVAYDPAWPSLHTMFAGWIREEITLTETALSGQAPRTCQVKLPLNLSVAHLACLLRLFYEENLVPNTSLTDMFHFIAGSYTTKKQDSISAGSLRRNPEEDEILRKVAARIKSLRVAKGYSNYEKFANEHNFGRSQYGKYEKGENMQLASLLKILKAFDISLAEFFKGFDK
ncbi:unnamed protein product [Sphagnum tenellum]